MKRPLFITIVSALLMILGVGCFSASLYAVSHDGLFPEHIFMIPVIMFEYGFFYVSNNYLPQSLFALVVVLSSVGIFSMKKWGYILYIFIVSFNVIMSIPFLIMWAEYSFSGRQDYGNIPFLYLVLTLILEIVAAYFVRSNILRANK